MDFLEFSLIVGQLKGLKRTGWQRRDVPDPESVADHSFRLAMLCLFLAPKFDVNQETVVKMALLHDLGEAKIGDIIIEGKYATSKKDVKEQDERNALLKILQTIAAEDSISLFDEFIERKTKEAKFVYQLDKLEAAIQAYEYESAHPDSDLGEYFETTATHLEDEYFREFLEELKKMRNKTI